MMKSFQRASTYKLALMMVLLISASALTVQAAGPAVCGGIQGISCPKGQFCDLPAGQCNSADMQGTCVAQPDACTDVYQPVCGCDGKTYGNDCERIRAGVQKNHDGECKKPV